MAQQAQSRAKRAGTSTAKRTSAGKEATRSQVKSRNETPNTPDMEESRLARLRVDELRQMARTKNIVGAATMRKGDLVRAVAQQSCGPAAGKGGKKSARSVR